MHFPKSNKIQKNQFTIQTKMQNWIVPYNCELVKALVKHQNLKASDLIFTSKSECKLFIKSLFLLALEDETLNNKPSNLAKLGQELISMQQTYISYQNHTH